MHLAPPPTRASPIARHAPDRYRGRLRVLGLLVMALVLMLHVLSPDNPARNSPLTRLNALWYDLRFQLLPPQRDARVPIVIVDLDEATQQREGRWPWDRRKVAQLIHALEDRGATLIGFDVVFSESGSNPARQLLDSANVPAVLDRALSSLIDEFDGDAALGRALGDNTVLGYFFHADGGQAGVLPAPFLELNSDDVSPATLISMPDYTSNLEVLTHGALASGFVVAVPDADGVVRRMPLVMRYENGVYASLSLEMARLALRAPWIRLNQAERGGQAVVTGVQLGRVINVPLDERGNILVPYRGPARSFPTVSATGVLRGDAPAELLDALDGAIVLVGTSALGLADLRTIPLQTGYPGVEAHANVLDTIIYAASQHTGQAASTSANRFSGISDQSPFYLRPDWEPGASLALLLLSGLVLALGLPGRAPSAMLVFSVLWSALVVAVNIGVWHVGHLAFPLALQIVMVTLLAALNIVGGYVTTARQKRSIQTLFGEYVPAEHVQRMLADPKQVSMEGEQRTMTVLFADVRNFTALSESLSAAELKAVLNRYLSAVTEVIFEHHGTIDKYVGDMVMAFWNAPLDDPGHARHAVQAALAMQARMATLRDEFQQEGLPGFHVGIGINTGPMNVGDMGSRYRRAYTVLGDAVNLASRLEALTSFYGVPILVADTTRADAPEFIYRTVDLVRVKGRQQSVTVSQPLDTIRDASDDVKAVAEQHERALGHYRARRWDQARAQFEALAQKHPDDAVVQRYLRRMAETDADQLPAQWSAVYQHETK